LAGKYSNTDRTTITAFSEIGFAMYWLLCNMHLLNSIMHRTVPNRHVTAQRYCHSAAFHSIHPCTTNTLASFMKNPTSGFLLGITSQLATQYQRRPTQKRGMLRKERP
jgi:hypothetical protein